MGKVERSQQSRVFVLHPLLLKGTVFKVWLDILAKRTEIQPKFKLLKIGQEILKFLEIKRIHLEDKV